AERRKHLPILVQSEQHRWLRAVIVPQIVVNFLEVPDVLTRLHIEGHDRGGEQVIADPASSIEIRSGIPRVDIDQPQRSIDRRRPPNRRASAPPGVSAPCARLRRKETPDLLSTLC